MAGSESIDVRVQAFHVRLQERMFTCGNGMWVPDVSSFPVIWKLWGLSKKIMGVHVRILLHVAALEKQKTSSTIGAHHGRSYEVMISSTGNSS